MAVYESAVRETDGAVFTVSDSPEGRWFVTRRRPDAPVSTPSFYRYRSWAYPDQQKAEAAYWRLLSSRSVSLFRDEKQLEWAFTDDQNDARPGIDTA